MSAGLDAFIGDWTFPVFSIDSVLVLLPDGQYGHSFNASDVKVSHFGTWAVEGSTGTQFLVMTLQRAEPSTDFSAFGWQPAMLGSSKAWAVQSTGQGYVELFGARLERLPSSSHSNPSAASSPSAKLKPAVAPPAINFPTDARVYDPAAVNPLSAAIHAGGEMMTNKVLTIPTATLKPGRRG